MPKSKELSEFVGNKIREFRKRKGVTQKELGIKIGVKHNTISDYERGKISPEQDMLFALSEALEVNVDAFFPARKGDESLSNLLQNSSETLSVDEMAFLKQLIDQVESLGGNERQKLMNNIRLAFDFFNKSNK